MNLRLNRRQTWRAAALAGAAALTLGAAPALAQSAGKNRARVPGEAVHYFSGDRRVDLRLVMDELNVSTSPKSELDLSAARAASPNIVGANFEENLRHSAMLKLAAKANRAELQAEADALAATLAPGEVVSAVLYAPTDVDRAARSAQVLTRELAVKPLDGVSIFDLAQANNLRVVRDVSYAPGSYILAVDESVGLLGALDAANALYAGGQVEFATPMVRRWANKRAVPNDALYSQQWHLNNTGANATGGVAGNDIRAQAAWDIATGAGVVIGITDDGVEHTHEDLSPGYRTDIDIDINFGDDDPNPAPSDGNNHGTSCAGCAAARGNNSIGVAGSAFNATLTGIRLTAAGTTDAQEGQAMTHQAQVISVNSNSWGPTDNGTTLAGPGPLTLSAFNTGVNSGRGGRGIVYMWAAGNGLCESDNINLDGYANLPQTIAVGATGPAGEQSWFSEPGAAMLINSPSANGNCASGFSNEAITTVDRAGSDGYDPGNYTGGFDGTSAATPIAAGAVALMLQANPNLGWRDVQGILVDTATKNSPGDAGWATNGAGKMFNHKFGFGRVNAQAAVTAAQTWNNYPASETPLQATDSTGGAIPDGPTGALTRTLNIAGPANFVAEHVEVRADIAHTYRGDLRIRLTAPSGMISTLMEPRDDSNDNYPNWYFMSVAHWGENPSGTWTLEIADTFAQDAGTLNNWTIFVHGHLQAAAGAPDIRIDPTTINFP